MIRIGQLLLVLLFCLLEACARSVLPTPSPHQEFSYRNQFKDRIERPFRLALSVRGQESYSLRHGFLVKNSRLVIVPTAFPIHPSEIASFRVEKIVEFLSIEDIEGVYSFQDYWGAGERDFRLRPLRTIADGTLLLCEAPEYYSGLAFDVTNEDSVEVGDVLFLWSTISLQESSKTLDSLESYGSAIPLEWRKDNRVGGSYKVNSDHVGSPVFAYDRDQVCGVLVKPGTVAYSSEYDDYPSSVIVVDGIEIEVPYDYVRLGNSEIQLFSEIDLSLIEKYARQLSVN